jgi:hypothetical protein
VGVDVVGGLLDVFGILSVGEVRINDDVELSLALGKGERGVRFGELGEDVLEGERTRGRKSQFGDR